MAENKVMVGVSGGTDSAAAAYLLKATGNYTAGAVMRLVPGGDSSVERSAKTVCDKIGIPFFVLNFQREFNREVISRFAHSYFTGETPNPCIYCNHYIKFGAFVDKALSLGFEFTATGHYARKELDANGKFLLRKAEDEEKDQTYFLYNLGQNVLSHVLFPVGGLKKERCRELVRAAGAEIEGQKESMDICFVPDGDYRSVLEKIRPEAFKPGDFVDMTGKVLGRHRGMPCYTPGQRRGLGIASDAPLYVVKKDAAKNRVVLGREENLQSKRIKVRDISFVSGIYPGGKISANVKVRYAAKEVPAKLFPVGDDEIIIEFDSPVRAAAPGQAAVFYGDDYLLGGGIICETEE